jgi:hypothetical protein
MSGFRFNNVCLEKKGSFLEAAFFICWVFIPYYAADLELYDFQLFRFSFGEISEEVIRNRKSKYIDQSFFLMHKPILCN